MKRNLKSFIAYLSIALVVTGTLIALSEAQQEKINPTLEQGIAQYKHENYDEALTLLKKAKEEDPKSTLAAYYLGLTYKQLQDYKAAVPHLRDAVTLSPKIKGALIELIDCLYQLGQLEEAKTWIGEAEAEAIRPAQTSFLKGLVLVKDGKEEDAIAAFENAKSLDKSMTQACDYQIGICYLKTKKFVDARKAFKEVALLDPGSNMANFANEYMDAITKREEAMKPLKLSVGVAWQYDDNVILKPSDSSIAANISDKGDSREVYTAKGEYEHRFTDMFGLKGIYSLYYSKQNDLGFYDVMSNNFVLQPNVYFRNSLLSFPAGYTHTIVNDKAYLSSPNANGIYNFMVGNSNMGQLFIRYQYKDYLWDPSTTDEDRTSNDLGGGCGWYLFYAKNKGFLNVRYALNGEDAKGSNWDYLGNRATVTLLHPVIDKLNATVSGDIYVQNFSHTHTIFQKKRNDTTYTVSALLAYKFFKESAIQLQYTYVKDSSNISVYDYSRNIYSVGVEFKF
jgi:tetratricopeptide (TPR) repeat protein